jgi:peptidoglycan/LPS O-acetylase OafA/YrhL
VLGLIIFQRRDVFDILLKNRLIHVIIFVALALCAYRLVESVTFSYTAPTSYRSGETFWLDTLCYVLISGGFLVYLLMRPASWVARILGVNPMKWLGLVSYEMYVIHYPVILIIQETLDDKNSPFLNLFLVFSITLPLSYLTHNYVTRPCLKNRDVSYEFLAKLFNQFQITRGTTRKELEHFSPNTAKYTSKT